MNQRANGEARSTDALTGVGQLRAMSCDPTEPACAASLTLTVDRVAWSSRRPSGRVDNEARV
jgi:hypothetical protein